MKRFLIIQSLIITLIGLLFCDLGTTATIKDRFNDNNTLSYGVYFNGVPVGSIDWKYLGKDIVQGRQADIVELDSDTNILKLLSIESKEKVFLDSLTHLPLQVERKVTFFGSHEIIKEVYDQQQGCVTIFHEDKTDAEKVLHRQKPIHHILALLYFFPRNIELTKGKTMKFNLPTQTLLITVKKEDVPVKNNDQTFQTYYLEGKGARRFFLWLQKSDRLPLKLYFPTWAGRITIVRKESNQP